MHKERAAISLLRPHYHHEHYRCNRYQRHLSFMVIDKSTCTIYGKRAGKNIQKNQTIFSHFTNLQNNRKQGAN